MLFGHLHSPRTYEHLVHNESLLLALDWIKRMPPDQAFGIYQLRGDEIFVNVHGYETLSREQCRFESHRRYVDIQYCIDGGELIDHQWSTCLTPDGAFDTDKDLQFYQHQDAGTALRMTPGDFAIFFPEDAHRPKVADGKHPSVRKLVVKLGYDLMD